MSSARPTNRQPRSNSGRALTLLGVFLAVLSGVLVVYIVSQATAPQSAHTVTVAVVNTHIVAGTPMTETTVKTDFTLRAYPMGLVPTAMPINSLDKLAVVLNQQVNIIDLYSGDVLLNQDARFKPLSAFNKGSITSTSPYHIPQGDILYPLAAFGDPGSTQQLFINGGDHVDIIATECSRTIASSGECEAQTTLTDIYVYNVLNNDIILVLSNGQAQALQLLAADGTIVLVVRGVGDTTPKSEQAVTPATIASEFHY